MGALLGEVLQTFEHQVKEGILVIQQLPDFPETFCDRLKIIQVWQNLISNAIKYRGSLKTIEVQLGWKEKENVYEFWVQDNGPGIPKDQLVRIFQPFVRLTDEVAGTGIGLTTVQRIIQAHGGKIYVDSDLNCGAKFIFELPIVDPKI